MNIEPIGRINCDFKEKFGIPRQSGLANTKAEIVFLPEYSSPDAFRGLEGYSHIWLLWGFDRIEKEGISLTVRPPRLGGNIRMGVFATRSPFRPNHIGLSLVELEDIAYDRERGTVLKIGSRSLRWYSHIRYKALSSVDRMQARGKGRLCQGKRGVFTFGGNSPRNLRKIAKAKGAGT